MASEGHKRIPPPIPGHTVPKEYVRQQLQTLGIKDVTEEEIESYAADLTKLIRENLCKGGDFDSPATSRTVTPQRSPDALISSKEPSDSFAASLQPREQQSAVFKTFPGDKENRVHFLSPSLSPSPARGGISSHFPDGVGVMSPSSSTLSSVGDDNGYRKGVVRRKVLRKCNGVSKVFDESLSESERGLVRCLSDLSLTSATSSDSAIHIQQPRVSSSRSTQCCKSFIRPPTTHPHTRNLKKCDPVNRYHEFREMWEKFKPPEEHTRNSLRWHIREQLMHQDVPYYKPQRRTYQPNSFVVPTDKKRSALRWEVRHALAHQ